MERVRKVALTLTIALLVVPSFAQTDSRAIACVGETVIARREVGCHGEDACPTEYRRKLAIELLNRLLPEVQAATGIVVAESEVAARAEALTPRRELDTLNATWRRIAEATLLVINGHNPEAVFREHLEPHGIDRAMFDHFQSLARSEDAVRHFLRRDMLADFRKEIRTSVHHDMLMEKLAARLSPLSDEDFALFWSELFEKTATVVYDPQFNYLVMRGALKRNEITIRID
jgi:hypothetical protein